MLFSKLKLYQRKMESAGNLPGIFPRLTPISDSTEAKNYLFKLRLTLDFQLLFLHSPTNMCTLSRELQVQFNILNFQPLFSGDTREVYATIDDLRSGRVRIGRKVFGGGSDVFDPQSP